MKYIKIAIICLVITLAALSGGCSKDSEDNVIPGYWSPGELRPRGIAPEKSFNFTNIPPQPVAGAPESRTCQGTQCMAVSCIWLGGQSLTQSVPVQGVSLNDDHVLYGATKGASQLKLSMTHVSGFGWSIIMVVNGVSFRNKVVPASSIRITTLQSEIETTPEYDVNGDDVYTGPAPLPPDIPCSTKNTSDNLKGSGKKIALQYVEFLAPIVLTTTNGLNSFTIEQTDPLSVPHLGDPVPFWWETATPCPLPKVFHANYPAIGDYIVVTKAL